MASLSFLEQVLAGKSRIQLPYCLPSGAHVQILDEGVIEFQPRDAAHRALDVVISCGIHGNETAPVELVDRLISDILDGRCKVRSRVLFIFGNVPALREGVRFVEEDMNRLFCRQYQQVDDSYEARRAAMLEMHLLRFFVRHGEQRHIPRLHWDLHTAIRGSVYEKFAIAPYPANGEFNPTAIARLGLADVHTVLLQAKPSVTFTYFSSRNCGAEAFTLELGKARPFGENNQINLHALQHSLRQLVQGELQQPAFNPETTQLFRVSREIIKHSDAFKLNLDDSVENFSPLAQGLLLASDGEQQWRIDEQGARIIFPNPNVKNGLRAGLIIVPAQLPDAATT